MATVLEELERKLRSLNFQQLGGKVILSSERELFDETRKRLFLQGEKADGTKITPPYTPFTKQIKQSKGQPTDRVTLFDTGRLHSSLQFQKGNTEAKVTFAPPYGKGVKEKYGDDVLNPSLSNNIELLQNKLVKEVLRALR